MFEIRKTETRATCRGLYSKCETYKDHEDWDVLKKLNRNIPKGELALFIKFRGEAYCVCKTHAADVFKELQNTIDQANEIGWLEAKI